MKSPPKKLSERALKALREYQWLGNIRELRNVLESAIVMSSGDTIEMHHLPEIITKKQYSGPIVGLPIGSSLEEGERTIIEATLRMCKNNKSRTAEVLGLQRTTLYEKIRRYKIEV